jgi:hypothetical protein
MVVLRADPWSPEYGMGFEGGFADEVPLGRADPFAETSNWSAPLSPAHPGRLSLWFVDGVRRVELRLVAEDGSRRLPGLFGSFAAGGVRCDGRALFSDHRLRRAVILGGGVLPGRVGVSIGRASVTFQPATDPGTDPDRPLWRLQQLMREEEGNLAARAADDSGSIVLVDGPLTFRDPTRAPVVGVVKRYSRQYLQPEQEALLARLRAGQRTPLFALGDDQQPVQRFAWYTRLSDHRPPWHDHAGVVRCEVRAAVGLEEAVRLADSVSVILPAYGGHPGDPRSPQNLAPVAALEVWLRHRMGDHAILRRALIEWLAERSEKEG